MFKVSLDDLERRQLNERAHQDGITPRKRDRLEMIRLSDAGWGIPQIAGHLQIHEQTVRYWIKAFLSGGFDAIVDKPHTGKKSTITPEALNSLEMMLVDEAAGNPMGEQKWVRNSAAHLSRRLKEQGFDVSSTTVRRLLRQLGYSLKHNLKKKKAYKSNDPRVSEQFEYIASQKQAFRQSKMPIISVDTKKKELIGDFQKKGKVWCKEAEEVNYYDFTSLASCRAVPYGVYDVKHNKGYVYVGTSGDTAEFAVDALASWWKEEGRSLYPTADKLLILADGGGNNGHRSRAWKQQLQARICDAFGLNVTVCHYPTGCSKWNPVERMLFSQISINWAGKPLRTLEIMLGYIRGTTTTTGLTVKAFLLSGTYEPGQKVTKQEMEQLAIQPHKTCQNWNYTISPREHSISTPKQREG